MVSIKIEGELMKGRGIGKILWAVPALALASSMLMPPTLYASSVRGAQAPQPVTTESDEVSEPGEQDAADSAERSQTVADGAHDAPEQPGQPQVGQSGDTLDEDGAAPGGQGQGESVDLSAADNAVLETGDAAAVPETDESDTTAASAQPAVSDVAAAHKGTLKAGTYAIVLSGGSRSVLDVKGASKVHGANVQLYESNTTNAQRWAITEDAEGFLTIVNINSKKVLGVSGGKAISGANVQQQDANSSKAQQWIAVLEDDGTISLRSALDCGFALTVSGSSAANGLNVCLDHIGQSADGTAANGRQRFTFASASVHVPSSGKTIADGIYTVSAGGLTLDVRNASTASGAALQAYQPNGSVAQAFRFSYDSKAGFYTIMAVNSGKLLDAHLGDAVPNGKVSLWGSIDDASHVKRRYWNVTRGDAGYVITNAASGNALSFSALRQGSGAVTSAADDGATWTLEASASYTWTAADADVLAAKHRGELPLGAYVISSGARVRSTLDVKGASKKDSANVQLYESNGTAAQRWQVKDAGNGYVYLVNAGSGKVLDVKSGKTVSKTNVQQYARNATRAQKWIPVKQANGSFTFYSALGRNLVLDVWGGKTSNGANVQIYAANGLKAQTFTCTSAAPATKKQARTIGDGYYQISFATAGGYCMDINGASSANGATVQGYAANGSLAQAFLVTFDQKAGNYIIRNAGSGKSISVANNDYIPGGRSQLWTYTASAKGQRWLIEPKEDGNGYTIVSVLNGLALQHGSGTGALSFQHASASSAQAWQFSSFQPKVKQGVYTVSTSSRSGIVLDVSGASMSSNANIQGYKSNKTFAQKWWIRTASDGTVTFQNVGSGKYAAASNGNVVQVTSSTSAVSKWKIGLTAGKGFTFTNLANGSLMTISGSKMNVGTAKANGSASQGWKLSSTSMVSEGFYELIPTNATSKRLDIKSASKSRGANAQIYASNKSLAQRYWIRSAGGGWYTITANNSALDLDVSGASAKSGTNVRQYDRNRSAAQKWRFEMGEYGVKIMSACGGNVLETTGSGNGSNVRVATYAGKAGQGWILKGASRPAKIGWQNPKQFPQVSSLTVKLPNYAKGKFTYVSPSRISIDATREDCVNAFIARAYDYLGTKYIEPWSTAPGGAVDCSGLVLQCLYATGMDMGIYNPYNHRWQAWQTYNSMNWYNKGTFMKVSRKDLKRGDVVYYKGHIAIYIGGGKIIDSQPPKVAIRPLNLPGRTIIGYARPYV